MQVQRAAWLRGVAALMVAHGAGLVDLAGGMEGFGGVGAARVFAQSTDPIGTAIGLKKPGGAARAQPAQPAQPSGPASGAQGASAEPQAKPGETAEQLAERIRKQKEMEGVELKPLPPVFPIVLPAAVQPVEQSAAGALMQADQVTVAGGAEAGAGRGMPGRGLRVWSEVSEFTPGNLAIHNGQVYVTAHPFGESRVKVYRSLQGGALSEGFEPFTRGPWAGSVDEQGRGIGSIIGIKVEGDDLWLLDAGSPTNPPKLIQWNLVADQLARVIHIPPPVGNAKSFLQDLAIDGTRGKIYIADCGIGQGFEGATPAIVVVDLKTGVSRRVLEGHASVQAEADARMIINGREVTSLRADGTSVIPKVGVNPIVIDREHKWVYYGAMHGTKVYRIKAEDLADESLTSEQLARRVDEYGPKPVSDGMAIDDEGRIFITDVNASAVGVLLPGGEYRIVSQSDSMLAWPDGLAIANGWVFAVVNQLHLHAPLNAGKSEQKPPFAIVVAADRLMLQQALGEHAGSTK